MKRVLSIILAVVMVFSMLPSNVLHLHAQAAENPQKQPAENPLKGKTLSILGASISTFAGTSNGVAADTTNSTIRNNVKYYPNSTIPEVNLNDTWWMQVVQDLELRLLVNNAWSGSAILLERSGTVGAYVDRCVQLHDDTGDNAGEEPDIICIQMGFNDFSYGKETLGTADIDYDALITQDGYAIPATTMEATAIMLDKMVKRYPNAEIYMFNHFKRVGQSSSDTALMEGLNASIATVCARFGVTVVDLYTTLTEEAHIGDGRLHPNRLGMDVISEAVKTAILSSHPEATAHTVSLDRNRVTADYVDHKIVLDGDSFTLNLTAEADLALDVKVTMGGKDITDSAYANGTVSIDAVTGDVKITAQAIYSPQNYRWEFDGTDLKCVSGGNDLTKNAGTTENGVFDKTRYALEQAVVLQHDLPWIVEWKSEGSWKNSASSSGGRMFTSDDVNAHYNARYIFKSSANGLIAMGEKTTTGSHNYGIALADHGIDASAPHTYRLENRIAADGSNMIWLYVDGDEIGPMNHYYVGTANQKTTSDWLSGKDFVFPYMGTDTHGLTNCAIDYIAVWEGGKQSYYQGKTISILGDSISTFSGVSNDPSVNATLAGSAVYYTAGSMNRSDTWWQQTIDALGMELLVNNSWSGSCVLHTRSGTVGAYVNRCVQLHNDKTGRDPDVIAMFLGTNDFSYYQNALGTADIDYDALIVDNGDGTYTYATPKTTCEAYAIILHKMTVRYPNAEVYCLTMLPRRDPVYSGADVGQPTAFNAELTKIITRFGATVVDLENCGITKDPANFDLYLGDKRVHPNAAGMDKMTNALLSAMLGQDTALYGASYVLSGVSSDNTATTILGGRSYTARLTVWEDYKNLKVTVTMGGVDITQTVYQDGVIKIPMVTGDIRIVADADWDAPSRDYRWEMGAGGLISTGAQANDVVLQSGSVSNGVLKNAYFKMNEAVRLCHDRPWVVEFKVSGEWSGMVLASGPSAGANGTTYFFKTTSNTGFMGFGERVGEQYKNYGIPLEAKGIDTSAMHIYRIENRIAADGSNMAYLLVDGVEIGPLSNYFISGSSDQKQQVDWVNGKDLIFSYIGASSHAMNNCQLDYLSVTECDHSYENGICTGCGAEEPNAGEQLSLRYDDRFDVTGKEVQIIDAGTPTSYKVGFGVAPGTPDDAVITYDGGKLIATGIGTARVRIDGTVYDITVTAAPISLLLLVGQSNMRGSEGNPNQSIVCPDGMVYATYGDDRGADNTAMTLNNATMFAPSALTGEYSGINVEGTTDCLSGYPVYSLTEAGAGKIGPDSGFAYEWVKQTGEKVWIVNAAHGGTSINVWQPGTTEYMECLALFAACQETLRKEIAAGHFTLSHMGYFWCQGCSDRTQSAAWYVEKYLAMHEGFKTELAFDHDSDPATADKTFEFGGIIPVRVGSTTACYRDGSYAVANPYAYHESFVDLRFSGPRVAQYWLGNNPDLPDIHVVCTIGESWVWMPDGINGVSAYFQAHYENGRVDYTTQVTQKEAWYTPTTPKAVHDSIHYNQIGYNEIGRESVRNMLYILGVLEAPEAETTVKFVGWDGFTEITDITAATTGSSATLVVPMVYPLWKAKEVTYQLTDGLTWNYYDLLADDLQTTGTLTALGFAGSVTVNKAQPGQLYADHLSVLPENVCCGLNLWPLLTHDPQYYASGTHWGVYSGGNVCSVTIPVQAGDVLYASSWGKAGENGHATSNGIRVTVFGAYGVVKTYEPAQAYKEFTANGGFLVMPEGATAINIAMWTDDPQWEIYILSREHDTADGICGICGKDTHVHSFSDWQTVTLPSQDGPGVEKRSCACGETESRQVDGVWQKYDLSAHMSTLPEDVCCGLNLWPLLEHDPYYFASGTAWGKHSGGNVCSVTIPVNPGDRILASSFGVAGGNGNSSTSGIRVTFFGVYGVIKTMTPAEVYAELLANDCLIAPEGTVAVNIPMWTNSDEWHLYILNREHSYTSKVTPPTCTEKGYTTYTCACGHSYVAEYVDATGHDYNLIGIVDPTCTEPGENHYRCAGCGDRKTEVGEPATGHKLGAWTVTKQPTCTEKGSERRDCANCDYSETRDIDAKGHDYSKVVTAPTCTEKGYTTYTCVCGDSYTADYVDAMGHKLGAWTVTKQPTCTEKGSERRDCANCGHFETREVAAKGHDYSKVVTAPTCTEQGYITYTCVCGDSYTADYVDALGHKLGAWTVTKQPTCTEKGSERRDCANCDYSETRDIDAKGHDYSKVVTAPTCTEQGYTTYTCVCGHSYVSDYVDATGHKLGAWTVTKEATCTEKGSERRDCANCGHFETREVAAKGHDYSKTVTAPTCTEKGYTTYTCACGHSYVAEYVDATGHDYNLIGIVDPTCTEPGENHYRCAGCGDRKTEVGEPATGHKLGSWEVVKQSTCTEKGKEERKCANCDYSETRDIAMTDHRYQNGICTDCGQGEPGFLWGDVNGDGYVDSDDAYLLLMFDAELLDGTELNLTCADVSGDGYADSDDAYLILMFDAELIDRFPGK